MKVSIVIPCFKQASFLGDALRSLRAQSRQADEVLVIDDGSPDDVASTVEPFADMPIKVIRKQNFGLSAARNTGILASAGEFLVWLDADDYLPANFIHEMLNVLAVGNVDVAYSDYHYVDHSGSNYKQFAANVPGDALMAAHQYLLGNMFPPHAAMTRRTALANAGLFDPALKSFEDWDLWVRMSFGGAKFAKAELVNVPYRQYPESMSKNTERMRRCGMQVLKKAEDYHSDCEICKRNIRAGRWGLRQYYLQVNTSKNALIQQICQDPLLAFTPLRQWLRGIKHKFILRSPASSSKLLNGPHAS